MDCRTIERWNLSSLVGAYLDVAVAYLLLCCATLAFIASKFLALFGLSLPCSCHPQNSNPNPNLNCLHRLLINHPATKIASLQASASNHFPFSSAAPFCYDVRFLRDDGCSGDGRRLEIGGDESVDPSVSSHLQNLSLLPAGPGPLSSCDLDPGQGHIGGDNDDHVGSLEGAVHNDSSLRPDESDTTDLEQVPEEEQGARAALCLELEKERSAAASAADEAMAMILRLQEEKASIEMEARQYHRMIEEKSAYDEEEMEILKEIIVRREMEKHVLEKEVEIYRQMMLSGALCFVGGGLQQSEDSVLMLQQISDSIGKKGTAGIAQQMVDMNDYSAEASGSSSHDDIKEAESNYEFQEKGVVTAEVHSSIFQMQRSNYGDDMMINNPSNNLTVSNDFHGKSLDLANEEDDAIENKTEIRIPFADWYRESDRDADQRGIASSHFEPESRIHDVHVIEAGPSLGDGVGAVEIDLSEIGSAFSISRKGGIGVDSGVDSSVTCISDRSTKSSVRSWPGLNENISRSCSDMTGGRLIDEAPNYDLKRRSMSAVDIERFGLETEVELLRKRLKIIQQGRDKLSFSVEHREKERCQLQLLDEIAHQLQEIRKKTEPEMGVRQASLPPPSSKVNVKKRRCRSVTWGVHDST